MLALIGVHSELVLSSFRVMYWSAWSTDQQDSRIVRTSMDGIGSTTLFDNRTVAWPNALALDYDTQTLYWIDGLKNTISKSDANGLNNQVILELNATNFHSQWHPFGMDFFNGYIYFGNRFNDSILTLEVGSPNSSLALVKSLHFNPGEIHVVHLGRQPITTLSKFFGITLGSLYAYNFFLCSSRSM